MVKKQTISKPQTTKWGNRWIEEKLNAFTKYVDAYLNPLRNVFFTAKYAKMKQSAQR